MKTRMKEITRDFNESRDQFVTNSNIIERVWLSNKWQLKKVLKENTYWDKEEIETFITLCPFYDENWWISWDFQDFEEIWERYKKKLSANLDVLEFLKWYFNLKITFILADQWVLINSDYDKSLLNWDLENIRNLYKDKIWETLGLEEFELNTFSDMWIDIQKTCNIEEVKTEDDIKLILEEYEIDFIKYKPSLDILIKAFKLSWAYFLIKCYLEENMQLSSILKDSIFINTEVVWPLNSLYTIWKYKLNKENLLVTVKIKT